MKIIITVVHPFIIYKYYPFSNDKKPPFPPFQSGTYINSIKLYKDVFISMNYCL
jgi:hypothetical protein